MLQYYFKLRWPYHSCNINRYRITSYHKHWYEKLLPELDRKFKYPIHVQFELFTYQMYILKIESSLEVLQNSYTLLDARFKEENDNAEIHCLLSSIVEKKTAQEVLKTSKTFTELHWVVIKKSKKTCIRYTR